MQRSPFLRKRRSPGMDGLFAGVLVFLVTGVSIAWLYAASYRAAVNGVRSDLMHIAAGAASQIDGDLHRKMTSPDQVGSADHHRLIRPLVLFHRSIPEIYYLYTAILKDGEVRLILDTSTQKEELGGNRTMEPSMIMDAYEPPDKEMIEALKTQTLQATREPVRDEFGTFLSGYAPFYDSQGNFVGIVGVDLIVSDFYERLQDTLNAALSSMGGALFLSSMVGFLTWRLRLRDLQGQLKLDRILDASIDAVLALQAQRTKSGTILDYRILLMNPAAKTLAGAAKGPEEEVPELFHFLPGLKDEQLMKELSEVVRTGLPLDREYLDQAREPMRWLRVMAVRLEDGLAMTLSDITWRKKEESELRRARDSAQAADRAKSEFLAMMSHEIRTPMNGIIGFTNLLESTSLNAEQKDFVETISSSANALLVLLNDILDFSKIESGQLELERKPVRVRKCVTEAVNLISPAAQEKGLELSCDIATDVPEMISGDSTRLRQILLNLLGNALKFTPRGTISLRVFPATDSTKAKLLVFEVQDTGIGISQEKIDRLFHPFTQADSSTTRKFGGTGLGLAICKRLVELMGGKITLASTVGQGSTFSFALPVQQPNLSDQTQSISLFPNLTKKRSTRLSGADAASSLDWSPLEILVAEDNPVNEKVLRLILKKYGYNPDRASNGKEAVDLCSRKKYDLVIMDVQMPEMDGYQAARHIRELETLCQPYIIALTADAMAEDRERCLSAGMNDYLTKPVNVTKFEDALVRCIKQKEGKPPAT